MLKHLSILGAVLLLVGCELEVKTPPDVPLVVREWKTGEWFVRAGEYVGTIDLSLKQANLNGVSASVITSFRGDSVFLQLVAPLSGRIAMEHAEGRMIGTLTRDTVVRPASAIRPQIAVVETEEVEGCVFVVYTDGSPGVAPNNSRCHQLLDKNKGPLRYVARNAEEE